MLPKAVADCLRRPGAPCYPLPNCGLGYFNRHRFDQAGGPGYAWRINFRVRDLDAMVAQLRAAGAAVEVDDTIYPNGRFAHLRDPEGNRIELWEPAGADLVRPSDQHQ